MKHYLEIFRLTGYKRFFPVLLFFLFLGLFLLQIILYFFFDSPVPPLPAKEEPVAGQPVISLHSPLFHTALFGTYLPADAGIRATSLDAELVGILYSASEENSQALIKLGSGREKVYHVGDKLPGGAVIRQIKKDSVVVFYKGAMESINLPKEELQFVKPSKSLFKD